MFLMSYFKHHLFLKPHALLTVSAQVSPGNGNLTFNLKVNYQVQRWCLCNTFFSTVLLNNMDDLM